MDWISDIVESTRVRRLVLGIYVACLAGVIGAYLVVSLMSVQTSAYVRGPTVLEKGRPNAVRGVVLNAQKGTFRTDVDVEFGLKPETSDAVSTDSSSDRSLGRSLGSAHPNQRGLIHGQLRVPEDVSPGPATLRVRANGPDIEPFFTETSIRIGDSDETEIQWPERTSRISNRERRETLAEGPILESSGDIRIDVLPPDGELVRGLESTLYLRTFDRETGRPVPAKVRFTSIEGTGRWGGRADLPKVVETDEMGMARLTWSPTGGQTWELEAREHLGESIDRETPRRTGRATLQIHTVAAQYTLRLDSPLVLGGRPVEGTIRSLFRSGDVFVDLFQGPDWMVATETRLRDRESTFAFSPPPAESSRWLYRVQIYSGLYNIGHAWETAHAVRASGRNASAYARSLDKVVRWLADHRDDAYFEHLAETDAFRKAPHTTGEMQSWLRAYLEAIPRHFDRPPTLVNTQKADRRALEAWKDEVQNDLMAPIALALLIALLVVLYAVASGLLETRAHRERLRDVDVEFDDEVDPETLEDAPDERREAIQRYLLIAITVATFVFFGLGLLMILSYM